MKKLLFFVTLFILTACEGMSYREWSEQNRVDKINALSEEARIRDTNPNKFAYQDGDIHGCDSGSNASGNYTKKFYKNVDMYLSNQYYKSGWDDGFSRCKAQGEMINGAINKSL